MCETDDATYSPDECQLSILAHQNIDLAKVEKVACFSAGEPGSPAESSLDSYLREGWVIFRIQTEGTNWGGHETKIYIALMKDAKEG